jgi:hypothetical protein
MQTKNMETRDRFSAPAFLLPRWQKARYELIETWYGRYDNLLDVANSLADCVHLASQHYWRSLQELPDWRVDGIRYICQQIKTHRRRAILIDSCGVLRLAGYWDS